MQIDSLYLISTDQFSCYLATLQKCFILEGVEKSEEYFSFSVLYARESDVFINFNERLSYQEMRNLYNKRQSQSNILFEFSEILRSNAAVISNSVSAELTRASNLLYPHIV